MPTATSRCFIESFDTALEMITDGTWDSGESAHRKADKREPQPQHTDGAEDFSDRRRRHSRTGTEEIPSRWEAAEMAIADGEIGESISVNDAHVATLNATGNL